MNWESKEEAYKEVLPMYVGSEARIVVNGVTGSISYAAINHFGFDCTAEVMTVNVNDIDTIHLRSYSSMTDEEALEFARLENRKLVKVSFARFGADRIGVDGFNEGATQPIYYSFNKLTPAQFLWLLKHGFDVFGLIELGYAKELTV